MIKDKTDQNKIYLISLHFYLKVLHHSANLQEIHDKAIKTSIRLCLSVLFHYPLMKRETWVKLRSKHTVTMVTMPLYRAIPQKL